MKKLIFSLSAVIFLTDCEKRNQKASKGYDNVVVEEMLLHKYEPPIKHNRETFTTIFK